MAEYREKLVQAGADEVTTVVTEAEAADIAQRLVLDGEVTYTALGEESIVEEASNL